MRINLENYIEAWRNIIADFYNIKDYTFMR